MSRDFICGTLNAASWRDNLIRLFPLLIYFPKLRGEYLHLREEAGGAWMKWRDDNRHTSFECSSQNIIRAMKSRGT
jgi:hypothetical protein